MPQRGDDGFTLIEILVAFTIAALMLIVLLRGFSQGIVGSGRTEAYEEGLSLAETALESVGAAAPLSDGAETRRVDGAFAIATSIHRSPDRSAVGYLIPYEVAVEVTWREGGQPRAIALRTLRLGSPEASAQ